MRTCFAQKIYQLRRRREEVEPTGHAAEYEEHDQHVAKVHHRGSQGDTLALPETSEDIVEDGVGEYSKNANKHEYSVLAKCAKRLRYDIAKRRRCQADQEAYECACCTVGIGSGKCTTLKEDLH